MKRPSPCPALLLFFAACALFSADTLSSAERIPLWPDGAPGAKGDKPTDQPTLTIHLPPKEKRNGAAVVVCPGGGYGGLAIDHEGRQVAEYFNSFGVSAFVLHYRLGSKGYHHPIQLGDAQRAIRLVRHRAKEFGIDPHRLGIMGFSAGGHLASTAGTKFDKGDAEAKDPIDRTGCRPDFMILCYPVISFTTPYTHKGSRKNLLGDRVDDQELVRSLSNELQVTKETPPTFLFHTNEDRGVPPENSILFYLALRRANVPAELHVYQKGRHGVGLIPGDPILSSWSKRLHDWLKTNNWLKQEERAPAQGSVSLNGKPAAWGMLTFVPDDRALPSQTIRVSGGKFATEANSGLCVGKHHVNVMVSRPSNPGEPYFRTIQLTVPDRSPYQVYVAADNNEFTFDFGAK